MKSDAQEISVFTPSRTKPEVLESILVQRHELLKDAVERVRESVLTAHKHHLLFVGLRGCGKSHLVSLIVSRLSADGELADAMRIAWLNEDETWTTLLELLLKIHSALEKEYPDEYRPEMLAAAYDLPPQAATELVAKHLLSTLGSRTLVVVVENLDTLLAGLGEAGQQQLRAFIQENPKLSIVATAQRLVEDLSDRIKPFFGFFQTEHLKPLKLEEATQLLKKIAQVETQGQALDEFLATSRGQARVRALHHLSGGNHRIYIVLSKFITKDSIDALVGPFMQMVDELTPYYQERIRCLPPLQRKIVECLCSSETTMPVKEIAKRLFATPQTISSQLQALREMGYVEANQRGRESLYEISEPMMRICIEVKDSQRRQPLRLLVDFLRVWYDDQDLKDRLGRLPPGSASCAYLQSAIERNSVEGNLRKRILLDDLLGQSEPTGVFRSLADQPEAVILALNHCKAGDSKAALACLDEALALEATPSDRAAILLSHAELQDLLGDQQKAIDDHTAVIDLAGAPVARVAMAFLGRGFAHRQLGDRQKAIEDYTAVIGLAGAPVEEVVVALLNRGVIHGEMGALQKAIEDHTELIGLAGAPVKTVAKALYNRGLAHRRMGASQKAIEDYTAVIGLAGAPVEELAKALHNRGIIRGRMGDRQREIEDYTAVIALPGAPDEQVAGALHNRGLAHGGMGDHEKAAEDLTAVIGRASAPVETVASALRNRGVAHEQMGNRQKAVEDFTAAIRLPQCPREAAVASHLALAAIGLAEGRWSDGFQSIDAGLEIGAQAQPAVYGDASALVGAVFSAGLDPKNRAAKVSDLLGIYQKHQALSALGEAIVQHIGGVFRAGAPFPSTDNLDGWVSAWEGAAKAVPDFRLPIRLLRTGVELIKAGGSRGPLLDLTSPERAILEQAFGFAEPSA